ncbi:haloacid dehalogenase type II [Streptomyces sp. G-G2]|uniref:haloacid dehalogenase type II n=1 Tax=Streptomyces sp. G-G2 TaxID=3046201 RepID=UPI0024BB4D73|nr:haloacid dehalogenase type II [Streptomyces sp. G-G2]MDJ0382130.1 haloacid dehalogenase type II [Streptomyces sp. G-G2]
MPRQNARDVLVFDVNETLSDMSPLESRFEEIGAPPSLFRLWFAGVLRDGFALTAAGAFAEFSAVAREGLRGLLPSVPGWSGDVEEAAGHVLDGLSRLQVHPDVSDGVRGLREGGFRLVTMTNGSSQLSERLLGRAGLTDCFEGHLDVSGPRRWKPARAAYQYVVDQTGVRPDEAVLVAVHPWDIDGAQRAGLRGAWLRRGAAHYPQVMLNPTHTAEDLRELAQALA